MVRRNGDAIMRFTDRHGGPPRQDLRQHAPARGGEMEDDDEGKTAVGRHSFEELAKGFYAAGRGADSNDVKWCINHLFVPLLVPPGAAACRSGRKRTCTAKLIAYE